MLKSTRNPCFATMSDSDVVQAFSSAKVVRALTVRLVDSGSANASAALDSIESLLFQLEDELYARDLDLPR